MSQGRQRRAGGVVACALLLVATSAGAQQGEGTLSGAVVDAVHGSPIPGATVVLQPEVAGVFPGPASGTAFAAAGRTAVTDSAGAYGFEGLAPGAYRLFVSRYSYRAYAVTIELQSGRGSAVSVGLLAEPIALEPVGARSPGLVPFRALTAADDEGANRLMAVNLRRRRFLTTDVRELTDADVAEAVTLGEPDVMRALQRLPGVAAPSDYSAELWTRGGPWSHTRVYFDGIPLFNPLHALGVLSGIGSGALGAVWFHPGARSAGIGEGVAGVVDLQSRRATGGTHVQADASLMSAGLAVDGRGADGRVGWMLSGRRTYLDWLSTLSRQATGSDEVFPYDFRELVGMADVRLGPAVTLEASGLWEEDTLTRSGGAADPLANDWGNSLARVSLGARAGGLNHRHTLGFSDSRGRVVVDTGGTSADRWHRNRSHVQYAGYTASLWPDALTVAGPEWTAGWGFEVHGASYNGPAPLALPVFSEDLASPTSGVGSPLWSAWTHSLSMAVAWAERTWAPDDRLSLRAGVRAEAGAPVDGGGPLRLAPRFTLRFAAAPDVALSGGWSRIFQYSQSIAPTGVHLASLVSGDIWVVAGEEIPVLRSDLLTFGMEAWTDPGRIFALNWFGRRTAGMLTTDPRPGPVFERTALVSGEGLAYGVEASVRQVAGVVTGSVAYTYSRSRATLSGLEFAAGSDRPHVLDATLMVRALPSLRLGGAFTGASGAPYTAVIADTAGCEAEPGCQVAGLPWATTPHALRGPAFASLDLLADWSTTIAGAEVGVYGQLRNALGRRNATVYVGGAPGCLPSECEDEGLRTAYERGIPRLPVLGIRVRR